MSDTLTLVVWLAKATTLLVLAIGITAGLRKAPAGARYVVWLATLVAVLLVPAVSSWSPLPLRILPGATPLVLDPIVRTPSASPSASASASVAAPAPTDSRASDFVPVASRRSEMALSTVLVLGWGAVSVLVLGWLLLGMITVKRIVRGARSLEDPSWLNPMYDVADRLDLERAPKLFMSDVIEMPFACGILRPAVVLPASAEQWTEERRRCVLFHELAHVRRRDLLGHTVGRVVCAIYWFHPLVWSAAKRLRAESERACDDLVLACGGARASEYANHLLEIVTSVRREGAPATALPMADKREFEGRMLAILDPSARRSTPSRAQSVALTLGLGVLSLTIAAAAPARREAPDQNLALQSAARAAGDTASGFAIDTLPDELPRERATVSTQRAQSTQQSTWQSMQQSPQAVQRERAAIGTAVGTSVARVVGSAVGSTVTTVVDSVLTGLHRAGISILQGYQDPARRQNVDTALLGRILRTDRDESVRRAAAWALQGQRSGIPLLLERLKTDQHESVREMSAWALVTTGSSDVVPALAEALKMDKSEEVRATSAWGLGNMPRRADVAALEGALSDLSAKVRQRALWAIGQQDLGTAPPRVVALLNDEKSDVRLTAAWVLGGIEDKATIPALREAFLKERSSETMQAEFRALTFMGDRTPAVIDRAMSSEDPDIRARAVRMIAGQGPGSWPWPWPWPDPRPEP